MHQKINSNNGWTVEKDSDWAAARTNGVRGESVCLPHTFQVEKPDVLIPYTGKCAYEKTFVPCEVFRGKRLTLELEGVMHYAEVYANGEKIAVHSGGYLPFFVPLSAEDETRVTVLVSNEEDKTIPPGKPMRGLDFHCFSGMYRNVNLIVEEPLRLTNAIADNRDFGGLIVTTEALSDDRSQAEICVSADICNGFPQELSFEARCEVWDAGGNGIFTQSRILRRKAGESAREVWDIAVPNPQLWHPDSPQMYKLCVTLQTDDFCSEYTEAFGIKTVSTDANGLRLNGEYIELNGANRHQQYPCAGVAASDAAQYRDAVLLKQAGFNALRLAHYPQAESFLRACDTLGLLVIDCIPGWQYCRYGVFRERVKQNVIDMIKRDRNRACMLLWELSLNETGAHTPGASDRFFARLHRMAKALSPQNILTCGDTSGRVNPKKIGYDVPFTEWDEASKTRPLLRISDRLGLNREYGDYEFGGHYSTTRAERRDGEQALLQQAWNYQIALNRNRNLKTVGNIIWEGIDHTRGCGDDRPISSSGILDIFRIPKPAYHFFRSQSCAAPMVHIAGTSAGRAIIYANCEEVALYAGETLLAHQRCDSGPQTPYQPGAGVRSDIDYWHKKGSYILSSNKNDPYAVHGINSFWSGGDCDKLRFPPFTFDVPEGAVQLRAVGYIGGEAVAEHTYQRAEKATRLCLTAQDCGKPLQNDGNDFLFVSAQAVDDSGALDTSFSGELQFRSNGAFLGASSAIAQGGIAAALLRGNPDAEKLTVSVQCDGLTGDEIWVRTEES